MRLDILAIRVLGDGTTTDRHVPTLVAGGFTDWQYVEAGSEFTVGIRANGLAYGWGMNYYGQLGVGNTTDPWTTPQLVAGGYTDWKYVFGRGWHGCGVRSTGGLYCWGHNEDGQFGNGTTSGADQTTPLLINGITMPTASYP